MLVTLAYPVDGLGQPDDTVEVDDSVGRDLLRYGKARLPDPGTRTVAELRAYAADRGIDLRGATRRADIEAVIEAAEAPPLTPTTVVAPTVADVRVYAAEHGLSTTEAKKQMTRPADPGHDSEEP